MGKIVKPDATDDEVEQELEGGGEAIFTEHMLASKNAQARAALEDVQEKHKDIQKLEKSIEELHQLFVDLSVLVESQGELLDTIEYSVSQSLSYTKTGVQELEKANEYARKSRKKMCILIAIVVVVIIVILFPILMPIFTSRRRMGVVGDVGGPENFGPVADFASAVEQLAMVVGSSAMTK